MKAKIWVIAPFDAIQEVAERVVAERAVELADCEIAISTSYCDVLGFDGSLPELSKAEEWGAEVIVSRGGTATYLAARTDIPVVEIKVTALDILHAFRQAGEYADRVGIAGCKNVTYECESLYDFLGLKIRQITLAGDDDFVDMQQAVNEGMNTLVGDALAVRFAAMAGIKGFLIESGKAPVYAALREAESVVRIRRNEQSRAELLRTVIDSSTDGIVAIDELARVSLFNKVAEELFQVRRCQALGRPVVEIIPNTRLPEVLRTGQAEIGEVQMIGGRQPIATRRVPIKTGLATVGAVATFQEVSQLQRYEQTVRQKLHDKGLTAKCHLDAIIGESAALNKAKELARKYAATDSTVMITGESGTGKELFAQSIHNLSPRRNAPFVAVNCAALPENLLESELLGYEEGAFSGAKKGGKIGLVELAHRGTLFFDEIAEMPLALQARILRLIQEKEIMRLGGHRVIPVDVRIIAATNKDLVRLVAAKRFREDLYYRLDVLPLHLPPLRERGEDIGRLACHFLHKLAPKKKLSLADAAVRLLKGHAWFGNVRELANVMERLVLLAPGPVIDRAAVESVVSSVAGREATASKPTADVWARVEELRQAGLGARKIAKILAQNGHELKYYQIAYQLDKAKAK